jgi:hypothetical protein
MAFAQEPKRGGGLLPFLAPGWADVLDSFKGIKQGPDSLENISAVYASIERLASEYREEIAKPWTQRLRSFGAHVGRTEIAEREQARRAAVAAAIVRFFVELAGAVPAVPCLAEKLARERTPGWSPTEDAEQVAARRDAYLAGWQALNEVQRYVRLGRKRLATNRTPASVLSLADQEAWVWQFVRGMLRKRYRARHHGHGGTAPQIDLPEPTAPLELPGDPLASAEQSLLLAECLGEVLNELPPDVGRAVEAKVRAKIAR